MKLATWVILTAFIFCATSVAYAQERDEASIYLHKSIKGGVVISSFHDTGLETGPRTGFTIGLAFDYRLHNRFSLHPEVIYIEKGGSVTDPSLNTEFVLTMDYFEFPVLARYYFPRVGVAEPHISAGPYAAALISTTSSTEVMDDGLFTPDDLVEEARTTGWGGVAGMGFTFHFPFNTVTAELRYGRGFSKAFERSANEDGIHQHLSFLVSFSF